MPNYPAGPQYLSQAWRVFQNTTTASSPALEFAEELFDDRISTSGKSKGQDSPKRDLEAKMKELGLQWHTIVEAMCPIESPKKEHFVARLNSPLRVLVARVLR